MPAQSRKHVPKLKYLDCRNIGWHVSYRDPDTGTRGGPSVGMVSLSEAGRPYPSGWQPIFGATRPPADQRHSRRKLDQHLATPKAKPRRRSGGGCAGKPAAHSHRASLPLRRAGFPRRAGLVPGERLPERPATPESSLPRSF